MNTFRLKIVTPSGIYRETDISMLHVTTTSGQMGILANHMPLASGLEVSSLKYIENGTEFYFAISGGFMYVNDTNTTVIVNQIEAKDDIDLDRALQSKQRAEKRLTKKTDTDILRAELALKKAITRINVKQL